MQYSTLNDANIKLGPSGLVEQICRRPIKASVRNCNIVFKFSICQKKTYFDKKRKITYLPSVILKLLTTTPNLTSNFETNTKLGENLRLYNIQDLSTLKV